MDKMEKTAAVGLERGKICEKKADQAAGFVYKVQSITRDGIVSRWMEAVNAGVNEYRGSADAQEKFEYKPGDEVNFFMFGDGRGMILGKIRRDI